jgi:hypothetical protein
MQLPRDMQHSWNKMYQKYSTDTVICIRKKMARTVLFKLPYSFYSNLETVNLINLFCSFETTQQIWI